MDLDKINCTKCKNSLEEGDILIKEKGLLYHHTIFGSVGGLNALMSCSLIREGNSGIFYKNKFYNLQKNSDKMYTNMNIQLEDKRDKQMRIYGQKIISDLSFLEDLVPD